MLTLSQVLLDSRLTLICGEDLEITQVEEIGRAHV